MYIVCLKTNNGLQILLIIFRMLTEFTIYILYTIFRLLYWDDLLNLKNKLFLSYIWVMMEQWNFHLRFSWEQWFWTLNSGAFCWGFNLVSLKLNIKGEFHCIMISKNRARDFYLHWNIGLEWSTPRDGDERKCDFPFRIEDWN